MKSTKTNGAKRCSLLAIALIAVIGFSFIACSEDGGGSGGGTGGSGSGSGWGSGWIEVKNNPFNKSSFSSILSIAYGNGKFVAAGFCYDDNKPASESWYNQMGYSSDGTTWKIVENNPFPDVEDDSVNVIAFGNGIFVAGGAYNYPRKAKIAYSSDGGVTWSKANQINDLRGKESNVITNIVFGNGKFIAIGRNREGDQTAYSSSDGANWTAISKFPLEFIHNIVFGNGKFIAMGSNATILSDDMTNLAISSDGVTWTGAESDRTFFFFDFTSNIKIAYGNGRFVAVDINGRLAYSTDGITWTDLFLPNGTTSAETYGPFYGLGSHEDSAIAFGNGRFVASHKHGIAYSSDGITWSALETPIKDSLLGSQTINTIAYSDDGRFFAGGGSGIMVYWKSK
jgi:hypothetical protein